MCGRYGFSESKRKYLRERYSLDSDNEINEWIGSYNIAPTQNAPIITKNSPNSAHLRSFGIKVPWMPRPLINAQSESVANKPTFKTMFRENRCIVPATFFFEWKRTEDGKQPYAFSMKDDDIFSIAGIYNDEGFVILTCPPNDLMKDIHDRHPMILKKEDEELWLEHDSEEDQLLRLFKPYPAGEMKRWKVSPLVNNPKNNTDQNLAPINE